MVATPMTSASGPDYLQPEDIAESVLYLLRLSPAAWPTEIVLERRDAS
jgi:3-oxoacyl-[acyl-carrier protein] reductase